MRLLSRTFLVAFILMASGGASGSDGTESPFSFGAGARELALGAAAVTDPSDATAIFWNPSHLTLAQKIAVIGMHSELLANGVAYQYFGVVIPTLDLGGFGIGLFRQSVDGIEKRDDDNVYLGQFDDSQLRLYVGYGRRLGGFDVGASFSLDHQSIDTYRATSSPGLSLSAGHQFDPAPIWLNDLRVSAVVRNLLKPGIKLAEETYRYPTILELGGSVCLAPGTGAVHTFEPFVTFRKAESNPLQLYGGLEYIYKETLRIRTGFRQRHLSIGAGLALGLVSFDYALVDRDLDYIHLFALTVSYGPSVDERRRTRAEKQEADFRKAMNTQMQQRNLDLIDKLLAEGHDQLASGLYDDAAGSFDRLIFLARSTGLDDSEYQKLLDSAVDLRLETERTRLRDASLDSARTSLASGDFLSARYHALEALEADSESDEARQLFTEADETLKEQAERTEFVSEQLIRIDALLDSRRLDQAELMLQSLAELAPEDDAVMRRANRLELERLRLKIADMESARDAGAGPTTSTAADSLTEDTPQKALSEEQLAEISDLYQEAKELFNSGDIRAAVQRWERVAGQSPNYLSVREFLVKAYRFLGLELYGQKRRAEAVEVWKKALALDPANDEIAEYIKRAEAQMKKLEELAHEQH